MTSYGIFAKYYDRLMQDVDYAARADYLCAVFKKHNLSGNALLDLACGTGNISFLLAKSGFDVIGVDASPEMLSHAMVKADAAAQNPIFICQDMRSLDLYGTVNAAVCVLDGINHLPSREAVLCTFKGVSLFLEPGGLFVFDLNTPYKLAHILSNNTFVYDYDDLYCIWQNSYNQKTKTCRFDLTFFEKYENTYYRNEESFSERAYSTAQIKNLLNASGLSLEAVYDDAGFLEPTGKSERLLYVARKA
jgi:ubiquinone/menaquinone biosynthesis C-methylase UbiE